MYKHTTLIVFLILQIIIIPNYTTSCFQIFSAQTKIHTFHPNLTQRKQQPHHHHHHQQQHQQLKQTSKQIESGIHTGNIQSQDHNRMQLLHQRLQACNVTRYCFVNDNDSTDQYSPSTPSSPSTRSTLERTACTETKYFINAIHVKTLVWKGVYMKSNTNTNAGTNSNGNDNGNDNGSSKDPLTPSTNSNGANNANDNGNDENQFNKPFYFVTALRIQDKVDMKSLRTLVKRQWPRQRKSGGVLILQMAEQAIAEELTGFKSGSMPPGWHGVPMSLFIDDYIIHDANVSFPPTTTTMLNGSNDDNSQSVSNDRFSEIIMSVGSGANDYSLHVSLHDLFNSSRYYHNNSEEGSYKDDDINVLIEKYKSNVSGGGRQICSFSRASVEESAKRKSNNHDVVNINDGGGDDEAFTALSTVKTDNDNNEFNPTQSQSMKPTSDNKEILKALTRKAFNVAARKKGKVHEVKRMIERMGDRFPEFMAVDKPEGDNRFGGEMNKNALHYAAWKGDLETITLLINTAKQRNDMDVDVVNVISTGEGNYGKTAIFYSITQCRDDAVLLLLSHGADLLIVNNKGQTPVSLAFNKLKKETLEFMYQMEEHQLMTGRKFSDYRKSHSDGQKYGDIDPRFIRAGDVNVDEFILKEIGLEFIKLSDLANVNLASLSLPRSVGITTSLMRQMKWHTQIEEISGTVIKPSKKKKDGISYDNSNEKTSSAKAEIKRLESKPNAKQIVYKSSNTMAKLIDGTEIDMAQLNTLYLKDVLSSNSASTQHSHELIDDEAGLLAFQFAVDESINNLSDDDTDDAIINNSWGLDCEWRPSHISGEESPVAVLQISSGSRAFVIDVQTLLQANMESDHGELTPNEVLLSESLSKLFSDPNVRILGFGIGQDLTKLAASFPHIPCFSEFNSVIDLQALSRQVYPGTPKQFMSSLQKAVAILLMKRLDKTEQCSEWDSRPLSASQLEYASLDATILPTLLEKMMTDVNSAVEKENGFFFKKHSYLQTSYRFQFLSNEGDTAYRVPMGSIKSALNIRFARQIWPTFKKRPQLPEVIPLHEVTQRTVSRAAQNKEKKTVKDKKMKRNPISVSVLTGDLSNLPNPGITLGYTKESVIERVVRKQVIESLPEDAYLQYNRRGGIIELGNCFLLFVNFGVGRVHHKYRNEFLKGGRQVTFTINQGRYEDGELLQTLLTPSNEAMYYQKPVLFFIRASSKDKFMFCGKVQYAQHEEKEDGDLIDLVLDLNDFDALVAYSSECEDDAVTYTKIVAAQDCQ